MLELKIDLNNCDLEPIHIPGSIQSHGYFVAINQEDFISCCSENIFVLSGQKAIDLVGKPLQYFEGNLSLQNGTSLISEIVHHTRKTHDLEQLNPNLIIIKEKSFNLIITVTDSLLFLEFEPFANDCSSLLQTMIGRSVSHMLKERNLSILLKNTASQVRKIIDFDRAMIYRFAPDGHGEVVGESKSEDRDSWLGHHFPASDIPQQARALYKINLTRLIANVDAVPSKILGFPDLQNLDLTHSQLRSVSPIHIQYLKNMGVASSFSISLIVRGELWGLIACHNYTPKFIDYKSRESAKLIGEILSSALEFRQEESNQQIHEIFNNHLLKLSKQLQKNSSLIDALTKHKTNLLNVIHGGGAVLVYEKRFTKLGVTPNSVQIELLMKWIQAKSRKSIFHTNNLESIYPPAKFFRKTASGLLFLVISRELNEYILFFKAEQLETISWAGNPTKQIEKGEDGLVQISPRKSFESWAETVVGKSVNWSIEELQAISKLREEITYAVNLKANALRLMNEKLKEAYEELDTFSYTISHDLKNPVSAIKVFSQLLRRDVSLSERGKQISKHIEDGAKKMNIMIDEVLEYSRIGRTETAYSMIDVSEMIKRIITEMRVVFHDRFLNITLGDLPAVYGDSAMVTRVFANLIGNAVKYSQHSSNPEVHIEAINDGKSICYQIKDNGIGIKPIDLPRIFELFKRMSNVGQIEGSGVGLAIVKRIMDKHEGKVWAESVMNEGSIFYASFKHAKINQFYESISIDKRIKQKMLPVKGSI